MSSILTLGYELGRTIARERRQIMSGEPAWSTTSLSVQEQDLQTGDNFIVTANKVAVLELAQQLQVTITALNNDNTVKGSFTNDMEGLIVLPTKTTITVSNVARFGYTLPINVKAVLG